MVYDIIYAIDIDAIYNIPFQPRISESSPGETTMRSTGGFSFASKSHYGWLGLVGMTRGMKIDVKTKVLSYKIVDLPIQNGDFPSFFVCYTLW